MGEHIIKDYGKTITPEMYIDALQGHQYIPQSDQCIINIIKIHHQKNNFAWQQILDVGCGPDRLSSEIAKNNCRVTGLDISESFIEHANKEWWRKQGYKGTTSFQCRDFAQDGVLFGNEKDDNTFDVILMQGVMHHVHDKDRSLFLQRSFDLLKTDGILIISDEFVKDYTSEDERRVNVCKFYLHIIDEARKGGFTELAREEAKNLIDDVLSGEPGAGHANEEIFEKIYNSAKLNNESFYQNGYIFNQNISGNLIPWLREKCSELATANGSSFNRGDHKVSIEVFIEEVSQHSFALAERYEIGPVKQLGGMGVLVFKKK